MFKDAGATLTVALPKGGQPPFAPKSDDASVQTDATKRFEADGEAPKVLASTVKLASVSGTDYDAVFYPGGHGPLWDLAEDQQSVALIERMYAADWAPCVTRAGHLITGQHPASCEPAAEALLQMLRK